jgi:hypothetical protein
VYYGVVQIQREFIFYTALGFFALTQTLKCALYGSCSANLKFIPLDFGQCTALLRMRGGPTYATRLCASLCSNGHPAIQLKYMYSTLLLALLFGRVVYASATA